MDTPTPLVSFGRRALLAPAFAALGLFAMAGCSQPQPSAPPGHACQPPVTGSIPVVVHAM